jgi:S1-C subfamily serine protease
MSKIWSIAKGWGILIGTWLATYGGFELWDKLGTYTYQAYLIPEVVAWTVAFIMWNIGNDMSKRIFGKNRISEKELQSVTALNAFVSTKNESRKISTEESLREISDNIVEISIEVGNQIIKGSGLMITSDGYIITAHHVVRDALEKNWKITVKTQIWKTYKVWWDAIHYNKSTDIAIIKASKPVFPIKPIRAKVSQDDAIKRGEEVRVLWFRDGQKYNSLWMITKTNHNWKQSDENTVYGLFETDVRGKPGQSWGVIVNGDGELLGITVYATKSAGEEIGVIGWAKISHALSYINQIAAEKSAKIFAT